MKIATAFHCSLTFRILLGAAFVVAGAPAWPQDWSPERNVAVIVNTAPGSGPDRLARSMQRLLQDKDLLKVSLVVINKPGGGGAIAYGLLKQKAGDPHVIAIASASILTNHISGRSPVGYSDLTAIARLYGEYIAVAVRPDSHIKSGRDMLERLKRNPGSITFGVATSLGNSNHQSVALAMKASGIDLRKVKTVVFQSGGQAITAMLGGHVDVVPASVSSWVGRLQEGQVRIIAVAAPKRLTGVYAGVPTWSEQGAKTVVSNWRGVVGSPDMSKAQMSYWIELLRKMVATPEWKRDLERQHLADEFLPGAAFAKYLSRESAELGALLKELDLIRKKKKQ